MENMKPGRFIVFEGGEGSGKTSAMSVATELLEARGLEVVRTREPGGTPGAEMIRKLLVEEHPGVNYDAATNALLFAAARRDHVENVIRPALKRGAWVVCDRFVLSTIAYQCGGEGLERDFVDTVHHLTTENLFPDLTLIMDVDPEVGLTRSRGRLAEQSSSEGRFESYDIDFHQRLRSTLLEYSDSPRLIIDAGQDIETVADDVRKGLQNFLAS